MSWLTSFRPPDEATRAGQQSVDLGVYMPSLTFANAITEMNGWCLPGGGSSHRGRWIRRFVSGWIPESPTPTAGCATGSTGCGQWC